MRASCGKLLSALMAGLALVALGATTVVALDSGAVTVSIDMSGVTFQPNAVANFVSMNVSVAGPDGQVSSTQSSGDPVVWVANAGMTDGLYRYEATVVTQDPLAPPPANRNNPSGLKELRSTGSFTVSGGQVVPPPTTSGSGG